MSKRKNVQTFSFRRINLKNTLFFSGLFFWIIQEYIMRTKYLSIFGYAPCTIMRVIALTLLVFKIVCLDNKYSVKLLVVSIICCVAAFATQFSSNAESSNTMINVFIICMAARGIDFTEICKFNFGVSGSIFAFTVLSATLGIIENDYVRELFRVRYYLGFDYVSFPSIYLVNIIFAGFYSYTKKNKKSVPWILIIAALGLNFWVYQKTVTRLAFTIILVFLALYVITEKIKLPVFRDNKFNRTMAVVLFPLSGLMTYLLSIMYEASDFRWLALNELLNNRLLMNNIALQKYGITAFGQVIESNTNIQSGEYFFIDSGYMNLLLRNGVVLFVLVLVIYSILLRNAIKTQNTVLAIWLVCVCLYCIVNGILLSPVTNCSLLAIWQIREDILVMNKRMRYRRKRENRERIGLL